MVRVRGTWTAVATALFVMAFGGVLIALDSARFTNAVRSAVQNEVDQHAGQLQRALAMHLRETRSLALVAGLDDGHLGLFANTVADLAAADDAVVGAIAVDDLVMTHVSTAGLPAAAIALLSLDGDGMVGQPLVGGESKLGTTIDPWFDRITEQGGVGVVGPLSLALVGDVLLAVQPITPGGTTFSVRDPMVILIVRLAPLLADAGLDVHGRDLEHDGMEFALTGLTSIPEGTPVVDVIEDVTVFGSETVLARGVASMVQSPGVEWELLGMPTAGWPRFSRATPAITAMTAVAGVLAYLFVRRRLTERARLEASVARATAELRATMAHDQAVFEHAPDGILDVDVNGVVLAANPAADDLLGRPLGGTPDANVEDLLPGFRVNALKHGGATVDVVTPADRVLEVAGVEWGTPDGTSGITVTMRDVTEQRRFQQIQSRYTTKLEEVTARLEQVHRMRSDLVSKVSHEIRTPMTTIRGFTELLQSRGEDLDPAQRRNAVAALHRHSERLWQLVSDLLQLAEADTSAAADVATVRVEDVVATVAMTGGLDVDTRGSALGIVSMTDLHQSVRSLLDNAAKYGAPPYRVTIGHDGDTVRVDIADHGDGIPADFVADVFEAFTQESMGDRRTATGLGIGLQLARTLIRRNGGDIELVSPAHPTIFRMTLPGAPRDMAAASDVAMAPGTAAL
jgi:signal transduction histidine kinase